MNEWLCEQQYRTPDLVLQNILDNKDNKSILFNTRKTLFLLSLTLGSRISELFSLMRGENYLSRLADGSFKIYHNPKFNAKNENPLIRKGPIIVHPFKDGDSALCPVKALSFYLHLTFKSKSLMLFVYPIHLRDWNIAAMRLAIVRFIKNSQPLSLPRSHDLRKMATSLAFYNNLSIEQINTKVGWKSRNVFRTNYLINLQDVQTSCASL